jgi:hypothetical protein
MSRANVESEESINAKESRPQDRMQDGMTLKSRLACCVLASAELGMEVLEVVA